jgi:transposase
MTSGPPTLPESRQDLVKIIDSLTTKNEQLEEKVRWFEEQFHLARHKQFGASSERSVTAQGDLFNEAEVIAETGPVEEALRQTITYERKKPGRRPIPKDLPIERIEYRLPEEEQVCACCGGPMHEADSRSGADDSTCAYRLWMPQLRKERH